jgi:hypothetical protein
MAPLLRQLVAEYAATGLPPAYLPKPEELPAPSMPARVGPGENVNEIGNRDSDREVAR